MVKLRLGVIGVMSAVVAFSGCGGSSDDSSARVRVFHASPDAPNVDVYVDDSVVLSDVPYPVESDFLEVEAGTRTISVTPAGAGSKVIEAALELSEHSSTMVIASNVVAKIAPIVAPVDRSEVPAGSARVRVIHAAPGAPSVDVYVVGAGESINAASPVLAGVPFGAVSGYLTVPVGAYDLFVTVAGTKTVAIEARGVALTSGFRGSVAALDARGGGAPFALKVLDESAE